MKKIKYGKTFAGYKELRSSFFDPSTNNAIVDRLKVADSLYRAQPQRTKCKICSTAFGSPSFHRNQVPYFICKACGHLNGGHQDTDNYNHALYADEESILATNSSYDDNDLEEFEFRVKNIYAPKVEWLWNTLIELGEKPERLNCSDMGCGAGHMVQAIRNKGFNRVTGYDVYLPNIEQGNKIIGEDILCSHSIEDVGRIVGNVEDDVVTSIFMLEHISDPLEWCRALKTNPRVKYALIAVPMFSPTVIMEMVFPHVMHRSLGLAHTHLFTKSSLNWLFNECGLEIVSEWWFGADAFDFHRNIYMHLKHTLESDCLAQVWDSMTEKSLDAIQLALDKIDSSSELHTIVRVN